MELSMMDLLLTLACFWLVYRMGRLSVMADLSHFLDSQELDTESDIDQLKIEIAEGQWFAYDHQDMFVAQAADLPQLFVNIGQRFPDRQWTVDHQELERLSGWDLSRIITAVRAAQTGS